MADLPVNGGQDPQVPPLSKWIKNQSVSLEMDGPSLNVTSLQSSSTPGARINGIKVITGQRYLLGVNGTCSAGNAFLYVKQSQEMWRPQTVKLCRDSCLSFTADNNSIDVGVLFGAVVAYGDKFTIHSWTLICEPEDVKSDQESILALRTRWDEMQLAVADLTSRHATMNERVGTAEKDLALARTELKDAEQEVVVAEAALTHALTQAGLASMVKAAIEKAKREPDGDASNAKKVHDAHIRCGLARAKETVAAAKLRQLNEELNRVHEELVRSRQEAGEVKVKLDAVSARTDTCQSLIKARQQKQYQHGQEIQSRAESAAAVGNHLASKNISYPFLTPPEGGMAATAVFLCEQQLLQSATATTTLTRTGTHTLEATARLHTDNEKLKSEIEKLRSRLGKVEAELQTLKQDQYEDRPYGWSIRAVRDTVTRCLKHDIASPSKAQGLPPLIVAQLNGYRAWNHVQIELVAAREKGWTAKMALKAGVPREVLLTVAGFAKWMLSD